MPLTDYIKRVTGTASAPPGNGGVAGIQNQLKDLEIFKRLDPKQIHKVARLFIHRRYTKGQVMIKKGDTGLGMFLIVSGRAEVFDERDGKRISLATLDAGKVVGEMSLIDEQPRSANVQVLEDTECFLLTRDSFNGLVKREPEILWGIVPILAERVRHADRLLAETREGHTAKQITLAPPVAEEPRKPATDTKIEVVEVKEVVKVETPPETREENVAEENKDEPGLFTSAVQLSTASFMFMTSFFMVSTQEGLRWMFGKGNIGKRVGDSEGIVSSLNAKMEDGMTETSKKIFDSFKELLDSLMSLFKF
jgi:CRP-like cAMP-binding protein